MEFSNLKKSFVHPICESSDKVTSDTENCNRKYLLELDSNKMDAKGKHFDVLNSSHTMLFSKVEEIRKWQTSLEMETKHKDKKIDELNLTIEKQRKDMLDVQLQSENLSIDLKEEIQKRSMVMEKIHYVQEMCSALRQHYNTLQEVCDYRKTIEETITTVEKRRMRELDELYQKFEKMCFESSQKVSYLENALNAETEKNSNLKNEMEEKMSQFKEERDNLYNTIRSNQNEMKSVGLKFQEKNENFQVLVQEKESLENQVRQLETSNQDFLSRINDAVKELHDLEQNKLVLENNLSNKINEVHEWESQHGNLVETIQSMQDKFDNLTSTLKENIVNLEKELVEEREKSYNLQNFTDELNFDIKNLKLEIAKLEDLDEKAQQDKSQLKALKDDYESLKTNLLAVEKEKQDISTDLLKKTEEATSCMLALGEQCQLLKEKEKELLAELEYYKVYEQQKEEQMLKLLENNNLLKFDVEEMRKNFEDKCHLIDFTNEEVKSLKLSLAEKERNIENLQSENTSLKDYIEKQSTKVCLDCQQLKEKVIELEEVKQSLKEAELQVTEYKTRTEEVCGYIKTLEVESTNSLISKATENLNLKEKIDALEFDLSRAKSMERKLKTLDSENEKLHKEVESLKENVLKFEEDIVKEKTTNKELRKELSEFKKKLKTAEKELAKKEQMLKEEKETQSIKEREFKNLESENKNLNKEVNSLQSKISPYQHRRTRSSSVGTPSKAAASDPSSLESFTKATSSQESTIQRLSQSKIEKTKQAYTEIPAKEILRKASTKVAKEKQVHNDIPVAETPRKTPVKNSLQKKTLQTPDKDARWDVDSMVSSGSEVIRLLSEDEEEVRFETIKKSSQTPKKTPTGKIDPVVPATPQGQRINPNIRTPSYSYRGVMGSANKSDFVIKRKSGLGNPTPTEKENSDIWSFGPPKQTDKKKLWFQPKNFVPPKPGSAKKFFTDRDTTFKKPQYF